MHTLDVRLGAISGSASTPHGNAEEPTRLYVRLCAPAPPGQGSGHISPPHSPPGPAASNVLHRRRPTPGHQRGVCQLVGIGLGWHQHTPSRPRLPHPHFLAVTARGSAALRLPDSTDTGRCGPIPMRAESALPHTHTGHLGRGRRRVRLGLGGRTIAIAMLLPYITAYSRFGLPNIMHIGAM